MNSYKGNFPVVQDGNEVIGKKKKKKLTSYNHLLELPI